MSGRRFRRAAAAAALGLGAVLGALAALYGEDASLWSIPLLVTAVLILCELVSLSHGPAPDAAVERPAVTAVLVGRCLVSALLASRLDRRPLAAAVPPDTASPPGSSRRGRGAPFSFSRRSRGGAARLDTQ